MVGQTATWWDDAIGSRACFLTFHRVATPASWASLPDRGFYLALDVLDTTLARLRRGGWQGATVDEILRRQRAGDRGRFVNISIDDTYRDTWEQALPVFREHGMPVTLFVTSGIPDRTCTLWSVGLETVIAEQDEIALDGAERRIATARSWQEKHDLFVKIRESWERGDPSAEYDRFCRANGYDPGALHERHMMDWDHLAALSRDPLVEIGAHTITHPRVSSLDATAALRELAGSRSRLEERLGRPVRHFAFPYGRRADCGPRDFALAKAAGYASAATTRKGVAWTKHGREADPYRLPRNTLNGEHRSALALQAHLTGLSGVAATVTGRL